MRLGAEADSGVAAAPCFVGFAGKSIGSWKQQCKPSFLSIVALRGCVINVDKFEVSTLF
ncbi:hypothetical protein DAI22_01g118166 [Oryza sativa Japonica Group]|nr:hypothetical protein DAI22_01g118166 [Oryza sativa Japonica Group]